MNLRPVDPSIAPSMLACIESVERLEPMPTVGSPPRLPLPPQWEERKAVRTQKVTKLAPLEPEEAPEPAPVSRKPITLRRFSWEERV
jgi:hypothetical protein